MKLPIYQVDAFADRAFAGNPAAVVPLEEWLSDDLMLSIAAENNLSETAFFVRENDHYRLRWFTTTTEVDLCGHATLASAHVLFTHLEHQGSEVRFATLSGPLTVTREADGLLAMDFPARRGEPIEVPGDLAEALGDNPTLVLDTKPMLTLFDNAERVATLQPDFSKLKRFCEVRGRIGVIATAIAPENLGWDFVSRLFSPAKGIDEDPVTGAAHTVLVPYWSARLGKDDLVARQISKRGGTLWCTNAGERVLMRGRCAGYLIGEISL